MAVPSPQSTNLTTKFTAGIQPDAHSFFSMTNLHPPAPIMLLMLKPLVNGLRISLSEASVRGRRLISERKRKRYRWRRGGGDVIGRVIMMLLYHNYFVGSHKIYLKMILHFFGFSFWMNIDYLISKVYIRCFLV